ncbi:MAG: four helix bundle protein [Clostridia bacterium]|nr:four helix bundle protein [Clostridia bacterium]
MNNMIEEKSTKFAVKIIKLCKWLSVEKKEYIVSKQLLRSGTSIGANVAEAQQAQSAADFIAKNSIALKEAAETKYWLRLLKEADYIAPSEVDPVLAECIELEKILYTIIRTKRFKKESR